MPTSSQSLILQMTNGQLPPFFGRRHWKPEVPPGSEWNVSEYPISTVQIKHNFTEYGNKRQKFQRKPQTLQRTGSAPELSSTVDFTTLPQILRIRGLHGSLRYDTDSASVHWKVNTIGPFYDRLNNRRTGLVKNSTPATLRLFHADRESYSVQDRAMDIPPQYDYQSEFRRQVRFHETSSCFKDSSQCHADNMVFMSMKQVNGGVELIKTDLESADYFKLIKVNSDVEEGNEDSNTKIPLFRLEKCRPTDVSCFRLAPTGTREVGDFKLVPPPGYIADDFRLVPSSEVHGAFVLLQPDARHIGQFRPIQCNKETSDEFHMVQAKIKDNSPDQYKMDVIMPREAWGYSDYFPEYYDGYGTIDRSKGKNIPNRTLKASENRYNYFDDVRELNGPIDNEYTLPDISLHQSLRQGIFHHKQPTFQDLERASTSDDDLREFNEHLEKFNKRYFETLQASPAADKRFVHRGYRNLNNESDDNNRAAEYTGSSSDWRSHNFDQWSRTTKIPRVESSPSVLSGLPG